MDMCFQNRVILMKQLKIKDNSQSNKEYFSDIDTLTSKVADKTLEQLEKEGIFIFPELIKDAEDITKDQMILRSVNGNFRTSNVMGFLGYGNERLIIESRFSIGEHDYFFQYLLKRVFDFPNIIDLNTDANRDNRLFDLLLFLFPHYLKSAMRKGAFKTYVWNKYSNINVKGTIDISRHIQENTPFTGNVAYSHREFTYDNYLMGIVRHTIEFIRKKPYGNNLLRQVKDEVDSIVSITVGYKYYDRRKVIIENKNNPVQHAYYHEYRTLQRLCLMILQHEKHQIGVGTHQIQGILFDGAWLWEEYINSLVGKYFYHPMNKGGKGPQRLFSTFEGKIGLIYPDFVGRLDNNRVVADAKYKPIGNIGNKDYLQILAYMLRFEAKRGFYFYPEQHDESCLKMMLNRGITYEKNVIPRDDISVMKCGLLIPREASNYSEFIEKIKINEQLFISKLSLVENA